MDAVSGFSGGTWFVPVLILAGYVAVSLVGRVMRPLRAVRTVELPQRSRRRPNG